MSRYIPAAIRRAVSERDADRCTYLSPGGRRCSETGLLEFHHLKPYARSAEHSVQGVTLRCRAHNDFAAVQDFGAEKMQHMRQTRTTAETPVAGNR